MVLYILEGGTSCYVGDTSSSSGWYLKYGWYSTVPLGGTLNYGGYQPFRWVVLKLWGGTLHTSEWYFYVIEMVPYDLVGGTLDYVVLPHMQVGGIFMLFEWYFVF